MIFWNYLMDAVPVGCLIPLLGLQICFGFAGCSYATSSFTKAQGHNALRFLEIGP